MKKLFLPLLVMIWIGLFLYYLSQVKITIPKEFSFGYIKKLNILIKPQTAIVKRVIDGDTIELENGEKIRYIGINTPETVDPRRKVQCFGWQAKEENKKLVEGKEIIATRDVSDKDKYGRLLRYVYIGDVFINDYLVRNGFASISTFPPDVKYAEQFKQAEEEARINNRGLWKNCPVLK